MRKKNEEKQIGLPGVLTIMLASSLTVMVGKLSHLRCLNWEKYMVWETMHRGLLQLRLSE